MCSSSHWKILSILRMLEHKETTDKDSKKCGVEQA